MPPSPSPAPDLRTGSDPRPADPPGHWRGTLRITGVLLLAWLFITFGLTYFARDLGFTFFGWPFGFWVAAQGAPLAYLAIVACYARRLQRLDQQHGLAEDD